MKNCAKQLFKRPREKSNEDRRLGYAPTIWSPVYEIYTIQCTNTMHNPIAAFKLDIRMSSHNYNYLFWIIFAYLSSKIAEF